MSEGERKAFLDEQRRKLLANVPPWGVRRKDVRLYGYSPAYMANLDSSGFGPQKIYIGGQVVYPSESFVEWLVSRLKTPEQWFEGFGKPVRDRSLPEGTNQVGRDGEA